MVRPHQRLGLGDNNLPKWSRKVHIRDSASKEEEVLGMGGHVVTFRGVQIQTDPK